jgi:hypothetical protein
MEVVEQLDLDEPPHPTCPFDYLIIVDFEATCDEKDNGVPLVQRDRAEIIEVPHVVVDVRNLKITRKVPRFCAPQVPAFFFFFFFFLFLFRSFFFCCRPNPACGTCVSCLFTEHSATLLIVFVPHVHNEFQYGTGQNQNSKLKPSKKKKP